MGTYNKVSVEERLEIILDSLITGDFTQNGLTSSSLHRRMKWDRGTCSKYLKMFWEQGYLSRRPEKLGGNPMSKGYLGNFIYVYTASKQGREWLSKRTGVMLDAVLKAAKEGAKR